MKTIWYFPLERIPSRYTSQLSTCWIPDAFKAALAWHPEVRFQPLWPDTTEQQIKVGAVLDAVRRSRFSFAQVDMFLDALSKGQVHNGDAIYLQDFWTPGFEAIPYALHQYGIQVRVYSTLWAQSVDEYDFTFPMRSWMRPIELGFAAAHAGIFVASTILKNQLQEAGVTCPIHVTSLPIDPVEVQSYAPRRPKERLVVFTSRLHAEKRPWFMLTAASEFLDAHPDWAWYVTTSCATPEAATNLPAFLDACAELTRKTSGRFRIIAGLSKTGYYQVLAKAAIQFNCSLQDYVAWTYLEAAVHGCDVCYPDFRSFPECVPADRRYDTDSVGSAVALLDRIIAAPREHPEAAGIGNVGRHLIPAIVINGTSQEHNVYRSEVESCT